MARTKTKKGGRRRTKRKAPGFSSTTGTRKSRGRGAAQRVDDATDLGLHRSHGRGRKLGEKGTLVGDKKKIIKRRATRGRHFKGGDPGNVISRTTKRKARGTAKRTGAAVKRRRRR
jgi:hypothetical protein